MVNIFMDSCAFHPPKHTDKNASTRLFNLFEEDRLIIEVPYGVVAELSKLNHPVKRKLMDKIHTIPVSLTTDEEYQMRDIQQILFGHKKELKANDIIDIRNVFEAQKYGCAFFVTCDEKHILSKARALFERFQLQVMSPSQCVEIIEAYLNNDQPYYSDLFKDHP